MNEENFLKAQRQIENIFSNVSGVKTGIIRNVLQSYWNPNNPIDSIKQTIGYLQIHSQLDKQEKEQNVESEGDGWWMRDQEETERENATPSPWEVLVSEIQRTFPTASTVKVEDILKDYWILFPKYKQVLSAVLKDPRLTGVPIPHASDKYNKLRVQKMNDGRVIVLQNSNLNV